MSGNNSELEKRRWAAADELRANSNLTTPQYSAPVLGLIFLRYADARFSHAQTELEGQSSDEFSPPPYLPFNVNDIDKEKIKNDRQRHPLGMLNPNSLRKYATSFEDYRQVIICEPN